MTAESLLAPCPEIHSPNPRLCQGRRHEVLTGGGGEGTDSDTQTHLPPNFNFFSEFAHFILKMLENMKG